MDEDHNVGVTSVSFVAEPLGPSPDGGTWVGLARDDSFIETFGQILTGLIAGDQYEVSWYQGNFGANSSLGYDGDNAIELLINSASVGSGAVIPTGRTWSGDSVTFVAPSDTVRLDFRLANPDKSYLSIDGISITEVNGIIPEPLTLLAAAMGIGCMAGYVRRRRQA